MTATTRNLKFTESVKGAIFREAGHRCSNPKCRKHIYSWDKGTDEVTCLAEACHIYPARDGGPRYDQSVKDDFITSKANGLCLCLDCHKIIDRTPRSYSADTLFDWKNLAKERNQPEFNQLRPDLGPGRTMGQEVQTLEKYLKDKEQSFRDIESFLIFVERRGTFGKIEVSGKVYSAIDNVAGTAMHSLRYEITWSKIQDELLYLRALAGEVNRELSLNTILEGGLSSRPHPYKKDFFGKPSLEYFYHDPLAEKMSQVVLAAYELKHFCRELADEVFSR